MGQNYEKNACEIFSQVYDIKGLKTFKYENHCLKQMSFLYKVNVSLYENVVTKTATPT